MMAARSRDTGWMLGDLLDGIAVVAPGHDRAISALSQDSRITAPGSLFFARRGLRLRGDDFIAAAIRAGAVAVVREGAPGVTLTAGGIPMVSVPDVRRCIGRVASRFHGDPSAHLRVIGVTGTNGKTSVSHFIAGALHGWRCAGATPVRCGLIGTLGSGIYGEMQAGTHTTPDAISTHAQLARIHARGAGYAVMEVSSHALDQARVAAVRFDTGVFTNLSRDHLDYHGDMRAYGEAKRSLFHHPGLRCAVVNTDDAFGRALLAGLSPELEITGFQLENGNGTGDARRLYGCPVVRGRVLEAGRAGMRLRIDSPWGAGEMRSPLLGRFNASNLLAALGAVLGAGVPFATALERLGSLRAPPGRLECFGGGGLPLVVVDYAHTPDALERALQTLRATCAGALWCVFGCGGERDRGKRPLMGGVSAREADVIVLTDDNPRNEDGRLIIDDIQEGVPAGSRVMVERDRALAIRRAVCGAEPGDVVLVAGKGHEPYQDVAGARRSFSDAAEVRAALRERDR